ERFWRKRFRGQSRMARTKPLYSQPAQVRIGPDYTGRRDRARAVTCGALRPGDSSAAAKGGLALRDVCRTVGGCRERPAAQINCPPAQAEPLHEEASMPPPARYPE